MSRRIATLAFVLLAVVLVPGAAPAQAQDLTAPSAFLALFPELRTLPAPNWVREGLRVNYSGISAAAYQGPDEPAPAGGGLLQTDVVAKDSRTIALSSRFLLDTGVGLQPSFTIGETSLPGVGPFWINPSVLVDAERVANEDLAVNHTTSLLGERTYNVVRFDYASQGATYAWVFEETTGLLLFHRYDMGEDGSKGFQQFVSMRRLALPWRATAAPDWVVQGLEARYEGTYTAIVAGGDPIPLPYAVLLEVKQAQGRWTLLSIADATSGQPGLPVDRVTGVTQLYEGFWLPAQALAASPRRSVIDRDPASGAQVSYTRSGGMVLLSEEGASWRSQLGYDAESGALLTMYVEKQSGIATIIVDLQLVQ